MHPHSAFARVHTPLQRFAAPEKLRVVLRMHAHTAAAAQNSSAPGSMLHVTGDFGWAVRKSPAACRLRCTHTRAAAQVVETRSTRSIVQTAAAAESLQGLDIVLSSDLKPLLPRCNPCCIAAHRLQRVTERVRVHWAALVLCCALWRAFSTADFRGTRSPNTEQLP